jgi:hypothetical protein
MPARLRLPSRAIRTSGAWVMGNFRGVPAAPVVPFFVGFCEGSFQAREFDVKIPGLGILATCIRAAANAKVNKVICILVIEQAPSI